ncbi:MAG: RDD family protein [candidate division Zixibacteria bacterium]|nr:RDD family protein [candidate division Zixibacteria bacterium]MBU1470004.1 RDD family protein [candidate division Zixibacteria bacterium]MBU2626276.1 RDD family protein [candidate division Zixibacteria bacterium]
MKYAGLLCRFVALVIDFMILSAVFFPVTRIVKGVWIMSASDHLWSHGLFISDPLCIIFFVAIVGYFIVAEAYLGATVGKFAVGIRVIQVGGGKPGMLKSSLRNVLRVVDSLPALNAVGVVLILTSDENARFGDRIAGTRVTMLDGK